MSAADVPSRPPDGPTLPSVVARSDAGAAPGAFAGPAPTALGEFDLQAEIGRGGMGVVYRARQRATGRAVAVKLLPRELSDVPGFEERFARETSVLSRLRHPNIIEFVTTGMEGSRRYLVMEQVEGESLRVRLGRGRLPLDEAIRLTVQVCDGLDFAHRQGIVHRDIKPENLLIQADGVVKIADFGLARAIAGDDLARSGLSVAGTAVGTPYYIAPEKLDGWRDVDGRGDLYSVGVVLYEAIVGRLPIGTVRPPSASVPGVQQTLDELVMALMESDPAFRPKSAGEVAATLRTLVSVPLPTEDPFAGAGAEQTGRGARNRRRERITVGIALLAGIAAIQFGRHAVMEGLAISFVTMGVSCLALFAMRSKYTGAACPYCRRCSVERVSPTHVRCDDCRAMFGEVPPRVTVPGAWVAVLVGFLGTGTSAGRGGQVLLGVAMDLLAIFIAYEAHRAIRTRPLTHKGRLVALLGALFGVLGLGVAICARRP